MFKVRCLCCATADWLSPIVDTILQKCTPFSDCCKSLLGSPATICGVSGARGCISDYGYTVLLWPSCIQGSFKVACVPATVLWERRMHSFRWVISSSWLPYRDRGAVGWTNSIKRRPPRWSWVWLPGTDMCSRLEAPTVCRAVRWGCRCVCVCLCVGLYIPATLGAQRYWPSWLCALAGEQGCSSAPRS